MKERALKLADQLDGLNSCEPVIIKTCETMIRRLVEELDKQKPLDKPEECKNGCPKFQICDYCQQTKPLSDKEIMDIYKTIPTNFINFPKETIDFARAIEERHGIK